MPKMAELRKEAKTLGIAPAVIRGATTASELQSVIEDHNSHDGNSRRTVAKKKGAVKKASAAKKKARKARKARKVTTAKRSSGRKASAPVKSRKSGTTKRQSNSNGNSRYVPKGGRNTLDGIDYSYTDGWNPRAGSAPEKIIRALKKFKGNRTKVFDFLSDDVWSFVGRKKADGSKRTKSDAEAMLKYRIARTAFDFALQTGQHEVASNRVEYGTGGTGQGVWKPAKKAKATQSRSAVTKGRKASQAKTKTAGRKNASQSRRKASTAKRAKAGSRR